MSLNIFSKEKFIFGGYYLIQPCKLIDESFELIPKYFYSQSNCICDKHPALPGYSWTSVSQDERREYANKLNLNDTEFSNFQDTIDTYFDKNLLGWSNTFYDIDTAREFYNNFLKNLSDVKLFAIGLKLTDVDSFKVENSDCEGILNALKKNIIIPSSYKFLGFEILGYEWNGFHSFACHDLIIDYKDKLSIDSNGYGLIDNYDNAVKATNYTNFESSGVEPVYWQPWAVFECSL